MQVDSKILTLLLLVDEISELQKKSVKSSIYAINLVQMHDTCMQHVYN